MDSFRGRCRWRYAKCAVGVWARQGQRLLIIHFHYILREYLIWFDLLGLVLGCSWIFFGFWFGGVWFVLFGLGLLSFVGFDLVGFSLVWFELGWFALFRRVVPAMSFHDVLCMLLWPHVW